MSTPQHQLHKPPPEPRRLWPAYLDALPPCRRCGGRAWKLHPALGRWICTCYWTWYPGQKVEAHQQPMEGW